VRRLDAYRLVPERAERVFQSRRWLIGLEPASGGVYFHLMKDEWNERLRCPVCGNAGMASLYQDDGAETPTVQTVPNGFKVVAEQYGLNFNCETCDVAVQP
jgi:hypothetical protein